MLTNDPNTLKLYELIEELQNAMRNHHAALDEFNARIKALEAANSQRQSE